MKTYTGRVIAEKIVNVKGKDKKLIWFVLFELNHDNTEEFVDVIKMWSNKNICDLKLGDRFECNKGYNKDKNESFLYNIIKY